MTPIYHLTHGRNLASILRAGGLWSPLHAPEGFRPASIAHENIQARRRLRLVPVPPGGSLHDYVPFYFGTRSPMLYANHRGWVEGNPDGQRPLVYLVSTIERAVAAGARWVFTDGHAAIRYTRFFCDLGRLSEVDWQVVHGQAWFDTLEDPDRKRRKQAEFLVSRFYPLAALEAVLVVDAGVQARVRGILSEHEVSLPVRVDPAAYY
ncbi:MAG: DUF4433 domain-containing protein [Myxococcales bacterium]|nr:DUF4433 domain-containing protein [Myxococcales bacterium]MCB9549967.1 DUF4433 domain-containing protein [Myxococcales bacterium]